MTARVVRRNRRLRTRRPIGGKPNFHRTTAMLCGWVGGDQVDATEQSAPCAGKFLFVKRGSRNGNGADSFEINVAPG
jgi:hypothetical protein